MWPRCAAGRAGRRAGGADVTRSPGSVWPCRAGRVAAGARRARRRGAGSASCARSGRTPSTTWPPASGPACPCPKRWRAWPSGGRRRLRPPFAGSPTTTTPPVASAPPWTGSRRSWPTRPPTGSSRRCGWPGRSAAASWAACCGPFRGSSGTAARPQGAGGAPDLGGGGGPHGLRDPVGGPAAARTKPEAVAAYRGTGGAAVLAVGRPCRGRLAEMLAIGRLPTEERVLR